MENIFIKNKNELEKKIQKFIADGAKKLHVITDFDRTLTPALIDGKRATTSFAQAREEGYLGEEYTKKAQALFDHYYPIEISSNISNEKRSSAMREWYEGHLNLMIEYGMNRDVMDDIVAKGKIVLRAGGAEFFRLLDKQQIPILIFSAGLGDIIKNYFIKNNLLTPNVHLISNFFNFSDDGKAIDYIRPAIHTCNKNEIEVGHTPYFRDLGERKNVLLLGNDIGDLGMSEGFNYDEIIRIGFTSHEEKDNEEKIKQSYDLVIENDGDMEYVNELLSVIPEHCRTRQ